MSKLTVGVLRGGPSHEYDVSLQSGGAVLSALSNELASHYAPIDIFIDREGTWHRMGLPMQPAKALAGLDIAFNSLKGGFGEDGKVQQILEHFSCSYTGSEKIASALAMNKYLAKEKFREHHIKTPHAKIIRVSDSLYKDTMEVFRSVMMPAIVKPASSGSSLGITIVRDYQSLLDAMRLAFHYSSSVIVEEYIEGKEATCAVMHGYRGEDLYALMPVEVVLDEGKDFYDFEAKYGGKSQELCPGRFSKDEKREITEMAKKAHNLLGLRHYSRADFIVHPRRGVYLLEVNTLPELHPQSLFGLSLQAIGTSLPDFVDHSIKLALRRN